MNVVGRVKVDNSDYRMQQKRYASTLGTFAGANGFYSDMTRTDRNIYADVMVNIDKRIKDFSINANIGALLRIWSMNRWEEKAIWPVFLTSLRFVT